MTTFHTSLGASQKDLFRPRAAPNLIVASAMYL